MKRYLILLASILILAAGPARAEVISGFITAITDGDTIQLRDGNRQFHSIRIEGIDAPEKTQPFGVKSQANMGRLAFNKNAVADCPRRDRYGHLVCKVTVNGVDVGLQQLADGMAWWYRKYARDQSPEDRASYGRAETMAKLRRLGLWAGPTPMPPWEWRQRYGSRN